MLLSQNLSPYNLKQIERKWNKNGSVTLNVFKSKKWYQSLLHMKVNHKLSIDIKYVLIKFLTHCMHII